MLKFKLGIRIEKKVDLSDFECDMVISTTCTGQNISETASLLGFSHKIIFKSYREWSEKEKNIN